MRAMAETAVAVGIAILALVIAVTVLSVTFATRGAMATNHIIVEVLHYVAATDSFIANQFQRHFLLLGLKGGGIGGGLAIALFGIVAAVNVWFSGTPSGDETAALFGTFTPFASTWLIDKTGDKASPGFWLMFGAALGIVAALTVYRGGRTIATREAVTA